MPRGSSLDKQKSRVYFLNYLVECCFMCLHMYEHTQTYSYIRREGGCRTKWNFHWLFSLDLFILNDDLVQGQINRMFISKFENSHWEEKWKPRIFKYSFFFIQFRLYIFFFCSNTKIKQTFLFNYAYILNYLL